MSRPRWPTRSSAGAAAAPSTSLTSPAGRITTADFSNSCATRTWTRRITSTARRSPIPEFRLNQFGGFIGGRVNPRAKDAKTFFFFDYQGQRIRQGQTYISSLPTAAFAPATSRAGSALVFDPLTTTQNAQGQFVRQQFPGNIIPSSRIDQVGKNIVNLYPQPNRPAW